MPADAVELDARIAALMPAEMRPAEADAVDASSAGFAEAR
jgi:hypothetical protein